MIDKGSEAGITPDQRGKRFAFAIVIVVSAGLALRIAASSNDLWLDEIWSVMLATQAGSAWDVIFSIRHDNNHWLNTLWLYATLGWNSPLVLRGPAIFFGTATILLMAAVASQRGRSDAIFAAILGAASYPLVHYSSEARGYAGATCFALLSVWLARKFLATAQRRWAALFWMSCVLGWLSHLTFLFPYLAILLWSSYRFVRKWQRATVALKLVILHGVPVAFFLILYLNIVRDFAVGGGNPRDLGSVLGDLITISVGMSPTGTFAVLFAAIALSLTFLSAFMRLRERADVHVLYIAAVVAGPLFVLWRPVEHLHLRYFVISVPFLLLLASHGLAWLARRGRAGSAAACVVLLLFVIANSFPTAELLEYGRGQYRNAINDLAVRNEPFEITLMSDHDFRNTMVLQYHARVLRGQKRIVYLPLREAARANWLLIHRFERDVSDPAVIEVGGDVFVLRAIYPHGGLSGWTWVLYQKEMKAISHQGSRNPSLLYTAISASYSPRPEARAVSEDSAGVPLPADPQRNPSPAVDSQTEV